MKNLNIYFTKRLNGDVVELYINDNLGKFNASILASYRPDTSLLYRVPSWDATKEELDDLTSVIAIGIHKRFKDIDRVKRSLWTNYRFTNIEFLFNEEINARADSADQMINENVSILECVKNIKSEISFSAEEVFYILRIIKLLPHYVKNY